MKPHSSPYDDEAIHLLYRDLLESWNRHDANDFAELFAKDGNSIGFDGSQMNGQETIREQLSLIFQQHEVASYVGIVREVRALSPTVYLLRAVAGMVPPSQTKIKSDVNAIQTLIAQKEGEQFRIALFHNTPAAFHGRPEAVEHLTKELQEAFEMGAI